MSKLLLFKRRFPMGELCQFQNLVEVKKAGQVSDADRCIASTCKRGTTISLFASRFEDTLSVVIPDWVINPFASIEDEEISLQLELLDLQTKAQASIGLPAVLAAKTNSSPVSHCVGRDGSSVFRHHLYVVTDLITKKRNRLQLVKRGDLRLRVTSISPNIDKLVRSQLCEPSTSR
ncbi:LOW QUALITY PROTEIN: hypothetical protein M513_10062 [Trichuris suis]|uniref:Uncharacterized protein n=1 Tax=Trichuris suis TaxID=68888 RepID=A0A085LVL8_9BILA|nr:LOW QUALITY PROTEIN: hypothetical protein M513_10062 [Trichuris suis]